MKILSIAAALTLCAGCSVFGPAVPTTEFKLSTGGQTASWSCPKQFSATNVVFKAETNGTVILQVGAVNSANDPLVIDKSYAGQIMLWKQVGDTGTQLLNAGGNLAMKAAASTTNTPSVIVLTNAPPAK